MEGSLQIPERTNQTITSRDLSPQHTGGAWAWRSSFRWGQIYLTWLPLMTVLVGIALRTREYIFDRSLWGDEIAITQDIVGRTFRQLMHVTPNGQAAPIGWFWAERLSIKVLGVQEYSLRLVPFAASLLALVLFPYVARKLIGRWAMPIAFVLFSTSPQLIYHSSEVKQYSSDVTCALLVVAVTLAVFDRPLGLRVVTLWSLTAACVIWFSQPGILIAAGCGVALSLHWWRRPSGLQWIGALGILPIAVLVLDYSSVLRQQSKSKLLHNYWAKGYPPRPLRVVETARWLYHDVSNLLGDPGRFSHPVLVLLLGFLGTLVLLSGRSCRWTTFLLVMPLALAVTVAVLQIYPLRSRLSLYLLPFIFMIMSAGLKLVEKNLPATFRGGQGAVAAVIVVAIAVTGWSGFSRGVRIFNEPLDLTAGRQSVAFIAQHIRPGDVIYLESPWALPSWEFYARHYLLPIPADFHFVGSPAGCTSVPGVSQLRTGERVWVFLDARASTEPADAQTIFLSYFRSVGNLLLQYDRPRAEGGAFLFQVSGSGPPPRASWIRNGCLRLSGP